MNEREKTVLAKLSEYTFCPNETKAVLHMLGGGDFRTVPVPESSRERLITMLKKKGVIEKVQGRYVFTPEFAGVFNGGCIRDGQVVASPAPRASAAPVEKAPEPSPLPVPAPSPAPVQKAAPAAQPALQAAPAPTPTAVAVESRPALARFPAFTPRAQAFLNRAPGQQGDTLREWFRRSLGEKAGQVALDAVSDLAAGIEPRHNPALDKTLADLEALAHRMFKV
ncbi:hypothetical protein BURC_03719 [Burkholderiaceae bacterium]|nr:hypothetical protein BURC_03719 [Burkholderiaceae bacterium]